MLFGAERVMNVSRRGAHPTGSEKGGNPMKTQTFGIEIETTGLGRRGTAEAIARFFGTTARYIGNHLDNWEVDMPDGRHWTVESDGSVTDPSAEVVSPMCRWEDIEMVQKVVRVLRNAGARVDESCGIHIHVGLGSHTPKTLRNLVNIVNAKEDLLTMALGITPDRRGRWCKPVEPLFLQKLNSIKPKTMEDFARVWYTYSGGSYSDWRRCATFEATLHAGKIKAYIQLCLAISAQALAAGAASPRRPETDNPKYTFRCWLLRLGFIGDEFATAREHLLKNLPGNAAWRQAS